MTDALAPACNGYMMQLRQNGQSILSVSQNYAINPVDGSRFWAPDVPMHIASMSKNLTAMAATQIFDARGLSYDLPISGYLPAYWAQGANIGKITFRNLMTHTSGLRSGQTDYPSMKAAIAAGVNAADYGVYAYENMNFSLLRILLAVASGFVATNAQWPQSTTPLDTLWDVLTSNWFLNFIQTQIFAPSNAGGHMVYEAGDALGYNFPEAPNGNGMNDGDLVYTAGAAGWHMSITQLLDVMGAFIRGGVIVTPQQAGAMLENGFGIDWIQATAGGIIYGKNGYWSNNEGAEQGVLYYLPGNLELVVLVNSAINAAPPGPQNEFLIGLVANAYAASLG